MKLILYCICGLLFIAFCCHGNQNEFNNEHRNLAAVKKRRFRRETRPKISVINKSGGIVNMYYMDTRYHRRRFFTRLRQNEKTGIRSRVGTTWLAYNENDEPLYLNTRFNFLVLPQHYNRKNNVIITTSKRSTKIEKKTPVKSTGAYYVEVLVVADSSIYNHYKNRDKIMKYIRVLIQSTNQIFADKSIDIKLHIVLKKIELYTREVASLNFPVRNPGAAINMICKHLSKRQRIVNKKIDFGIVLTRKNFGYAGFTPLYQMCKTSRSCTLIKDNGLQSAFVIAHEIGHSLGISHDGDLNDCLRNERLGSVMGKTVYSKYSNFHWSKCSKMQLHQNIRNFNCLINKPHEYKSTPAKLPGEIFNIDDQCEYTFGPGYGNCIKSQIDNRQCQFLYCRIPDRRRKLCSFMNVAPVDGTKCAEGRWCIGGKCLPHGLAQPEPIDGQWSTWSAWSRCTHTCGKGLQKRTRTCSAPRPEYNGKNCTGESQQWSVCTEKPCDVDLSQGDRRDYFCYGKHGEGWKYFSSKKFHETIDDTHWKCDFENGLCGWKNSGTSEVLWTRNNGSTKTQETGPDFDYTYRNESGHYLYLESSHPTKRDEAVKLSSPLISTPEVCLHFSYHMKGRRLGALKVNVVSERKDRSITIWEKYKRQSRSWLRTKVSITFDQPFLIELEAICGSSYYSDIAIDDILVKPGLCNHNGSQSNPCGLPCYNDQERSYKLDGKIPTGEKCYSHTTDMCINGECQVIGCDEVFNSTRKMDFCGVCEGDNSSCFHTDGVLKISSTELDQVVMKLSKNLKRIQFEKLSVTPASLAISKKNMRSRTFYQTPPKHYRYYYFKMADSNARYLVENETQKIFLDGKISDELFVQLSHPDASYDISAAIEVSFSYIVPMDTTGYVLRISTWSECTKLCGNGTQSGLYACVKVPSNEKSDMSNCLPKGVVLKEKLRPCNEAKCKVSYSVKLGSWSACPKCGKVSYRQRTVQCMRRVQEESPSEVSMEYCKDFPRYKKRIKCFTACPVKRKRRCIEISRVCPRMFAKGYCKYTNVQTLCCKTCKAQRIPR